MEHQISHKKYWIQIIQEGNSKKIVEYCVDGQEDGVPKACPQQAAADPRGSRTCVCANSMVWHTQGEKGEITRPAVVPSSRRGEYLQ